MIVRFPTGLYKGVLPKNPDDVGNVTFTISNKEPPRTNLIYPKIPNGITNKTVDRNITLVSERRKHLGTLVFTVSKAQQANIGNTNRQYEIGQVSDFSSRPSQDIELMLVSQKTEIQHNTNEIDYQSLGLAADEQDIINNTSINLYSDLESQLSAVKQMRADSDQSINSYQKLINDTNRALDALKVISAKSNVDVDNMIAKLEANRDDLFEKKRNAISASNAYAAQAESLLASLRQLSVVVK